MENDKLLPAAAVGVTRLEGGSEAGLIQAFLPPGEAQARPWQLYTSLQADREPQHSRWSENRARLAGQMDTMKLLQGLKDRHKLPGKLLGKKRPVFPF